MYNPKEKQREELPEEERRLHLKDQMLMLGQFMTIEKNGVLKRDLLRNHINQDPEIIFKHVYWHKREILDRLRLTSIGRKMLFKVLQEKRSDLPGILRQERRKKRALRKAKNLGLI